MSFGVDNLFMEFSNLVNCTSGGADNCRHLYCQRERTYSWQVPLEEEDRKIRLTTNDVIPRMQL